MGSEINNKFKIPNYYNFLVYAVYFQILNNGQFSRKMRNSRIFETNYLQVQHDIGLL